MTVTLVPGDMTSSFGLHRTRNISGAQIEMNTKYPNT